MFWFRYYLRKTFDLTWDRMKFVAYTYLMRKIEISCQVPAEKATYYYWMRTLLDWRWHYLILEIFDTPESLLNNSISSNVQWSLRRPRGKSPTVHCATPSSLDGWNDWKPSPGGLIVKAESRILADPYQMFRLTLSKHRIVVFNRLLLYVHEWGLRNGLLKRHAMLCWTIYIFYYLWS